MSLDTFSPLDVQGVFIGPNISDDILQLSGRLNTVEDAVSSWFPYYFDVETDKGLLRLLCVGLPTTDIVRPHEWKVSLAREQVPPSARTKWNVLGGTIRDGAGSISTTVADMVVTLESGFIYLKIEREPSSRSLISAVIDKGEAIPSSDYAVQYFPLAEIKDERAIQLQFEEIRSHELMLVENGEFKLASVPMLARNTYFPPI